ncbi:MAG TPA: hypothetical protein VNH64_09540 [Parvularculaceae bacterium]|nr:hypothetical protein [Parvularculaceae bacterium]
MFEDPRSRREWRRFRLHTSLLLGGVSGAIRRQLLEDLTAHIRDCVENEPHELPEFERVKAALAKVGDPREFVAPLLADAVLNASPRRAGLAASLRAIIQYAGFGWAYLARAAMLCATLAVGGGLLVLAVSAILRPDAAGVFVAPPDNVQFSIFGWSEHEGTPFLYPWLAIALGIIGGLLLWLGWRSARRILSEILMMKRNP